MRYNLEQVLLVAAVTSLAGFARAAHSSNERPRGVGPEFAKFFKSAETFTCISHPSIQLSAAQVNDDFCDCPDGSDEPGTAACAHLAASSPPTLGRVPEGFTQINTTLALPGFYCKNKGHRPSYIPAVRVNDGVCDYDLCCDGSDEWAHVGGVKCEDRCGVIGKEWRKLDAQRTKSLNAALKKRRELVAEAAQARQQTAERIETLKAQIDHEKANVGALEANVVSLEKQERLKVVRRPKSSSGGNMGVLVSLAKGRINELRDSLQLVRQQRNEATARLAELEALLTTFQSEYNPNFNDEGVKRAVRGWETYATRDKGDTGSPEHDLDLDEITRPDGEASGEGVINWAEWEAAAAAASTVGDESDTDVLYKFEEYLPLPVRDWIDDKLRLARAFMIENGLLASSTRDGGTSGEPVPESPELVSARDTLRSAEGTLQAAEQDLANSNNELTADYGQDEIFRALKDRCIERDSGEYTYELCWLGQTRQKSKKGGSVTAMGNFASFDRVTVDEGDEIPADGRGLGSGERIALRYEGGQVCWNGPARSTLVVLGCAEQDELWKVAEAEKCVYRMEVGTPAVCSGGSVNSSKDAAGAGAGAGAAAAAEEGGKDEL